MVYLKPLSRIRREDGMGDYHGANHMDLGARDSQLMSKIGLAEQPLEIVHRTCCEMVEHREDWSD